MYLSTTQLKQKTNLLDQVKEEEIILTKRNKPFAVVIDLEKYEALMEESRRIETEKKLAALHSLESMRLGGKSFAQLKSGMEGE